MSHISYISQSGAAPLTGGVHAHSHTHTHTATQSRVLANCPDWQINIFRASYPLIRRFYFQFPLLSLRSSQSPSHTLRIRNVMCVCACVCVGVYVGEFV